MLMTYVSLQLLVSETHTVQLSDELARKDALIALLRRENEEVRCDFCVSA